MSYQTDDGQHEGWDAAEMPDGRFAVGSGNGGTLVRFLEQRVDVFDDGREVVDGRAAIGWRGICECGWRGPLWEKVTGPDQHDLGAHKVYDADPSVYGTPPGGLEDAIWAEWTHHLPPRSLNGVREATEDARKAQAQLDEAVRRARAVGCSWADIGGAAGITRQSAHERWGQR